MLVTKEFGFHMGHRLPHYEGLCQYCHGHSYKMHITVKGDVNTSIGDKNEGMVVDFTDLKTLVNDFINKKLDHCFMVYEDDTILKNALLEVQEGKRVTVVPFIPTVENMAEWIFNNLADLIKDNLGVELYSVKIWETPTSSAVFKASEYKNN
jgi:6-pyruvoyltetrahydropterin/6-carboxytetrahydropterin synthase